MPLKDLAGITRNCQKLSLQPQPQQPPSEGAESVQTLKMGRYYCDYCGIYTHGSTKSRKDHRYGTKHRENFQKYYERIREEQKRKLFERLNLPLPPMGMPPPSLFAFPPPPTLLGVAKPPAS